jgi:hypothetical protein
MHGVAFARVAGDWLRGRMPQSGFEDATVLGAGFFGVEGLSHPVSFRVTRNAIELLVHPQAGDFAGENHMSKRFVIEQRYD